jgi:hypothetical protein
VGASRAPLTIARRPAPGFINASDEMICGWSPAHIIQKCFVASTPARTQPFTITAQVPPALIFRCPAGVALAMAPFEEKATARSGVARTQMISSHHSRLPACAQAQPPRARDEAQRLQSGEAAPSKIVSHDSHGRRSNNNGRIFHAIAPVMRLITAPDSD